MGGSKGELAIGMAEAVQRAGRQYSMRQRAWLAWERIVWLGMEWRSEGKLDYGICKLLIKRHAGAPIVCADGTRIERGDRIGELHLDNRIMLELAQSVGSDRAALKTARLARAALRRIAEAMEDDPRLAGVTGLLGTTLLHRGLVHGLGFECRPMSSRRLERLTAVYLQLLLSFLHPDGRLRTRESKDKLVPMQLIHSRRSLKRSMGPAKPSVS